MLCAINSFLKSLDTLNTKRKFHWCTFETCLKVKMFCWISDNFHREWSLRTAWNRVSCFWWTFCRKEGRNQNIEKMVWSLFKVSCQKQVDPPSLLGADEIKWNNLYLLISRVPVACFNYALNVSHLSYNRQHYPPVDRQNLSVSKAAESTF